MDFERLVAEYGVWALGIGAGVEGETVVVLGGIMVQRGLLSLLPAIAVASMGSFVADQIFFAVGRRFRNHPVVKRTRQRPAFARALATFDRHPVLFVFAFRFLYGLRTVSPLAIGTTDLLASRFLFVNAAAAALWGATFIGIGFFFGHAIETVFGEMRKVEHVVLPVLGLVFILAVAAHFIGHRGRR